ncbi:hypothetical protein PISMIDRAFT_100948, partial [Pisolithus microcarpus 441]
HAQQVCDQQCCDGQDDDEDTDPVIKLPASVVGSHAWTSQQAADAMALGWKFG